MTFNIEVIDKKSALWAYMSEGQKDLFMVGEQLLREVKDINGVKDYSFLVFPFSKAYEGFLKQIFLDLKMITEAEYYGEDIRIGRILNPHFIKEQDSVYKLLSQHAKGGSDITQKLWDVWRKGRNQVFHYFPHNFRKLSYDEALEIIRDTVNVMYILIDRCGFMFLGEEKNASEKTTAIS